MEQILSSLKQKHNLVIGYDLDIATDFRTQFRYSTVIIVTDTNLASIYLEKLKTDFVATVGRASRILSFVIPPGEASKSRDTKASIEDFLLEHQCDRESCLVALGGGVIGDLIGFVASTYLRGISLVHIPTTLLAMVDSSIGGKNGVDTPHGKNLIGTFWYPKRNYINLSFLRSLPPREFYNGMAEIIKMAATGDSDDFGTLQKGELLDPGEIQSENLLRAVTTAILYKTDVVSQDCKDSGLRHLLNFGHTIGHGIEALLSPSLLHGECVSIGMILETKIAVALGHCKLETLDRLRSTLVRYKLPVSLADVLSDKEDLHWLSVEQIMKIIGVDKKNSGGVIRIVLLTEFGQTFEPRASPVPTEEVKRVLTEELAAFTVRKLKKNFGNLATPKNLSGIPSPMPAPQTPSFFLCLTLPDLTPIAGDLARLTKGVHAVELRVDLLQHPGHNGFEFASNKSLYAYLSHVADQVRIIQKQVPHLPIIYTPRTLAEGGKIDDNVPAHILLTLTLLGFHLGCEIIDVQMNLSPTLLAVLLQVKQEHSYKSKIIASYHSLQEPIDWSGAEVERQIQKGQEIGDVVKIVSVGRTEEDNSSLERFTAKYWANEERSSRLPLIAVNIGVFGEITRVRNRYLTPVTHADLPAAAPGQLTVEQILSRIGG